MNPFATTISDSFKQFGQAFVVAYYVPALAFVLVNVFGLGPLWFNTLLLTSSTSGFSFNGVDEIELALGVLLLSLVIAAALMGLNHNLILLFEGRYWWLKWGLLYPLTRFNRQRSQSLYGRRAKLQHKYRQLSQDAAQMNTPEQQAEIKQLMTSLMFQIEEENHRIEQRSPVQRLPQDLYRVTPTAFGNVYSVAEEYVYEHYALDAVLFWPRLHGLMNEAAVKHSENIARQKTALDLTLNFAFLSGLISIEYLLTMRLALAHDDMLLLLAWVISIALCVIFYYAAVGAVATLGSLIVTSFDFYRSLLLKAFSLRMPDDLATEQRLWLKLAAFVRRGDNFYFPQDSRLPADNTKD